MYYGWVVTWVSFVFLTIVYLLMYSFSVESLSFLRDFGWERGPTAAIFSLMVLVYTVACPFAGALFDRFGARKVITIGSIIVAAGLWINSATSSLIGFQLSYGILLAAGFALIAMVPHSGIIRHWFEGRPDRGIATGIMAAGLPMGILAVPLVEMLIDRYGWRASYQIMAAAAFFVLIPVALIFQRRAPAKAPATQAERTAAQPSGALVHAGDLSLAGAARTKTFWLLGLSFVGFGVYFNTAMVNVPLLLVDLGWDRMTAASGLSAASATALLGTVVWGILSDRIPRHITYGLACVVAALGLSLLLFFRSNGYWEVYGALAIYGVGSGVSAVAVAITADLFDGRNFGAIFGALNMGYGVGSFVGPVVAGRAFDLTGSYDVGLYLALAACFMSAVLTWWACLGRRTSPVVAVEAG